MAIALAEGLKKPFHVIDRNKGKLTRAKGAAVKDALKLTANALKVVSAEKQDNLGYRKLVQQRADLLVASGAKTKAREEAKKMRQALAKRGVHEPVLKRIDAWAGEL